MVLMVSGVLAYLSRGLKKEQNYSKETALGILFIQILHFIYSLN
jgi:hypothetical protein